MNDKSRLIVRLNHPKFTALMIGLCAIVLIRVVLNIQFPIYIFLIYSGLICVMSSPVEIVSFMCSLIAFSGSFQYRYALLIAAVVFLIKKGRSRYNIRAMFPLLLMMVWELMHNDLSQLTPYGYFQEFSELIALTAIMIVEPLDYQDGLPLKTFMYCTVFSCFTNLISSIRVLGFSLGALSRMGKVGVDIADFQSLINPNIMGLMCFFTIAASLLVKYKNKQQKGNIVLTIVLFVFILLSQSKTAILGVAVVYFLFFIFSKKKEYSITQISKGIVFAILIIILGATVFRGMVGAVLQRFSSSDITTGRNAIFAFYSMHLLNQTSNWLFGIGLFDYTNRVKEMYVNAWRAYPGLASYRNNVIVYKPSHNNIQELVVVWGIAGIALIIYLIYTMIKHKQGYREKINYIPIIVLFLYGIQGSFISSGSELLLLIFSLVCMEYRTEKRNDISISNY